MTCNFIVDGVSRFAIAIRSGNGFYTLHALSYPPNLRGGSVTEHHLFGSGQICIASGHEPRTIDRAKAVAMSWCEGWTAYQRTGVFPNGAKRITVNS